jgi:SAM-dependent methyltransferase
MNGAPTGDEGGRGPGSGVSPQWAAWRRSISLDEYEARFAHDDAHGEADLVEWLARDLEPPVRVLDAGCGTGRLAIELHRRGFDVVGTDLDDEMLDLARAKAGELRWVHADLATMELGATFSVVVMAGNVMLFCREADRSAVVAGCARHLEPGGLLVSGFACGGSPDLAEYDRACSAAGLTLVERWSTWDRAPFRGGDYAVSVHVA